MISVMFYADSYGGTSGYSRVAKELSKRVAKENDMDVYVQQLVSIEPAKIQDGVKILPIFGQRGHDLFVNSLLNNIRLISPKVFIPICDPFLMVRDRLDLLQFTSTKFIPYVTMDSFGMPDTSERILTKADKIITTSEYATKMLKEEGDFDSVPLWHGIDIEKFKPLNNKNRNALRKTNFLKQDLTDKKVFLVMGRNFLRKRHQRLIEAVARVNKRNPDNDAIFIMHVSDYKLDNQDLTLFIKRMETRYDVKLNNIIFTEEHKLGSGISEEQIIQLHQLSDVYISATSGEGFGMPTIEAMACKSLVILPDNTTAEELIGNNRGIKVANEGIQNTGLGTQQPLVDIDALANIIENVCENEYQETIDNAFDWVKRNCDWDFIAQKLITIIRDEMK